MSRLLGLTVLEVLVMPPKVAGPGLSGKATLPSTIPPDPILLLPMVVMVDTEKKKEPTKIRICKDRALLTNTVPISIAI